MYRGGFYSLPLREASVVTRSGSLATDRSACYKVFPLVKYFY